MYPVYWKNTVEEYVKKPYKNYKKIIRKFQPLIMFTNELYKELENKTTKEIINGTMPLNYFINKSLLNLENKIK